MEKRMENIVEDDRDYDFDGFDFGFDLDDSVLQAAAPKRRRRKNGEPLLRDIVPTKRDVRRYIPQLLINAVNSSDFTKLLTFFDSFMAPDGQYVIEYATQSQYNRKLSNFCETRGPELAAYMFTGYGALLPDMVLAAREITINTNNVNSLTKITMECSHNFTKFYNVSLDWTVTQLQALYRASQPNPFKELLIKNFNPILLQSHADGKSKVVENSTRKRPSSEVSVSTNQTLTLVSPAPVVVHQPLTQQALSRLGQSDSSASRAPHHIHSSNSSVSGSTTGSTTGRNSVHSGDSHMTNNSTSSSGYDLSPLVHSLFATVPRTAVPRQCYARCTYTIILEGKYIKNLYVTAVQLPAPVV